MTQASTLRALGLRVVIENAKGGLSLPTVNLYMSWRLGPLFLKHFIHLLCDAKSPIHRSLRCNSCIFLKLSFCGKPVVRNPGSEVMSVSSGVRLLDSVTDSRHDSGQVCVNLLSHASWLTFIKCRFLFPHTPCISELGGLVTVLFGSNPFLYPFWKSPQPLRLKPNDYTIPLPSMIIL